MHLSSRSMSFVTVASLGATSPRLTLGLLRSIKRSNHNNIGNQRNTASTTTRRLCFLPDVANAAAGAGSHAATAVVKDSSSHVGGTDGEKPQQTCVVSAALAFLEQKKRIVEKLSPAEYSVVDEAIGASVGGHVRHTLDHFSKCLAALPTAVIESSATVASGAVFSSSSVTANTPTERVADGEKSVLADIRYDHRVRGGSIETDPAEAAEVISNLQSKLQRLPRGQQGSVALRKTTVSPAFLLGEGGGGEHAFESNLERELFFCCHHGFHHDAMIRLILARMEGSSEGARALMGGGKSSNLGVAPSTAGFRQQRQELQQQEQKLDELATTTRKKE